MENNNNYIFWLIAIGIGLLCWFLNWQANKKRRKELEEFANNNGYVYKASLNKEEIKGLPFPKCFEDASVENYIEFLENDYSVIWGDRIKVNTAKDQRMKIRSGFYIFKFNNMKIPEFELTDKKSSLFSLFGSKPIEISNDSDFSSAFTLKGPFETQIKKYFTTKVRREFCKMDKNHLTSGRNLRLSDLIGLVSAMVLKTGEVRNAGDIQFYGKNNSFMVIGVGHNDLEERKNIFNLTKGIANALHEAGNTKTDKIAQLQSLSTQSPKTNTPTTKINNYNVNSQNILNKNEEQWSEAQQYVPENEYGEYNLKRKEEELPPEQQKQPTNDNNITTDNNEIQNFEININQNLAQATIEPAEQINWLVGMMSIDNNIHKSEFEIILDYGLQLGLNEKNISQLVSNSLKNIQNLHQHLKSSDLPYNEELMRALIRVVYADRKVAKEEIEMLKMVANKMKMEENRLKELLEEERKKLLAN